MHRRLFLQTPLLLATVPAVAAPAPAYAAARRGTRLTFPRDHGAHPEFRTEWWYVTGIVTTAAGDTGFQLTFFRSRTGLPEAPASPIAPTQILFAHAAISPPGQALRHAERAGRPGLGAGFSTSDCDVYLGSWSMRRFGEADGETLQLRVHDVSIGLDLRLTPTQPPWLQGDAGWSQKGARPALASHYVSWPQLRAEGTLTLDGKSQPAQGRAWFDHEWSSEVLDTASVGWDWIGINLDDGGALMAFRIRDTKGHTVYAHASLREADGRRQIFNHPAISFEALRHWVSPRNGARYPVEIAVGFGNHRITTRPFNDEQEVATHRPLPISYWEGPVAIDGSRSGRGYLELTGYAGAMAL
jgi:predicted secreted hydrolase